MFKFTTIYRRVDDEAALEKFFSTIHLPLAEKLSFLLKREVCRISHKPGGQSRFLLMFELYFESEEDFQQAMATPTGIELIQSLQPWAENKLITWFYSEAFEEAG